MGHRRVPLYADQQAHPAGGVHGWSGTLPGTGALPPSTGWSPEQVAGRLASGGGPGGHLPREHLPVHLPAACAHEGLWVETLPAAGQVKRGFARGAVPSWLCAARLLPDRRTPGHWEADLMLFMWTLERYSRILSRPAPWQWHPAPFCSVSCRPNGEPSTGPSSPAITASTSRDLPSATHSPWQKGGVENAIGGCPDSAPQDRPRGGATGAVYTHDSGLQQHPAQVPGLQPQHSVLHLCTSPYPRSVVKHFK